MNQSLSQCKVIQILQSGAIIAKKVSTPLCHKDEWRHMFTERASAVWEWSCIIWWNGFQMAQAILERYIFWSGLTQYTRQFALIGNAIFRIAHNMQWPSHVTIHFKRHIITRCHPLPAPPPHPTPWIRLWTHYNYFHCII